MGKNKGNCDSWDGVGPSYNLCYKDQMSLSPGGQFSSPIVAMDQTKAV